MFILFPYRVDVPFNYRPFVNWVVVAVVILIFVFQFAELLQYSNKVSGAEKYVEHSITMQYILNGWSIKGLFGHMWLHAGPLHLIGNLIFLWLFGNAVCSKIGNLYYLPVYIGLGLAAAISHVLFFNVPAMGASGAINGIVGMYLVFFPENRISYFFCWIFLPQRPVWFHVRSFWMILLWFAFDIVGALQGRGGVAYFAHIGGFVAGVGLGILMLKRKVIVMERDEKSILKLLGLEKKDKPTIDKGDLAHRQQEWKSKERQATKPKETPEQSIRFRCRCGQPIKISSQYAGRIGRCPKCSVRLRIPQA